MSSAMSATSSDPPTSSGSPDGPAPSAKQTTPQPGPGNGRPVRLYPSTHRVSMTRYAASSDPRGYIPVFEYPLNGHYIMIDCETGLVHFTGIWKSLGNTKADVVKLVESDPTIGPHVRKVRGGYLKIQGTWLPFDTAQTLARRVAWHIRYDLIPLFGPEFPGTCLSPEQPGFGQLLLSAPKTRTRRAARKTITTPALASLQLRPPRAESADPAIPRYAAEAPAPDRSYRTSPAHMYRGPAAPYNDPSSRVRYAPYQRPGSQPPLPAGRLADFNSRRHSRIKSDMGWLSDETPVSTSHGVPYSTGSPLLPLIPPTSSPFQPAAMPFGSSPPTWCDPQQQQMHDHTSLPRVNPSTYFHHPNHVGSSNGASHSETSSPPRHNTYPSEPMYRAPEFPPGFKKSQLGRRPSSAPEFCESPFNPVPFAEQQAWSMMSLPRMGDDVAPTYATAGGTGGLGLMSGPGVREPDTFTGYVNGEGFENFSWTVDQVASNMNPHHQHHHVPAPISS